MRCLIRQLFLAVSIAIGLLATALAPAQEKQSSNCTTDTCFAVATWTTPWPADGPPLIGCVLYIDGVVYPGGSIVTVPSVECRMPMPALPRGVYELRASGVYDLGETATSTPLILGTPLGRPDVQRRPPR